jgi:hypothetical protein
MGYTKGKESDVTHGICPSCGERMMQGEDYQQIRNSLELSRCTARERLCTLCDEPAAGTCKGVL